MRIDAVPFDYTTPTWRPYDAERLAALGAPEAAAAPLTGRGLPDGDFELFVRVPECELEEADLHECGKAAFLGQVWDGSNNTCWLSLADGSVWMRYGAPDEPIDHMKRINTSVETLQSVLAVYEAYVRAESNDLDVQAREELINQTVIRAVATDPEVFRRRRELVAPDLPRDRVHLREDPPRRSVSRPTRHSRLGRPLGT